MIKASVGPLLSCVVGCQKSADGGELFLICAPKISSNLWHRTKKKFRILSLLLKFIFLGRRFGQIFLVNILIIVEYQNQ